MGKHYVIIMQEKILLVAIIRLFNYYTQKFTVSLAMSRLAGAGTRMN